MTISASGRAMTQSKRLLCSTPGLSVANTQFRKISQQQNQQASPADANHHSSDSNHHHVKFDLSKNMSHTLLSNKALKRLARSQEALSSSTTTSESAVYRKPIQHPPPNNCHSILKQRSNPHFSVELENIRQHRILNIRPRELEAMMSDMLLDSPGSPTKSGGLHVRLSSLNQTLPNNNQPTSEDEELVVPLPAKKKRRNRKKSSDLFLQQHQQQKALGCAQTAAVGLHKAIGSQQLLLSTN